VADVEARALGKTFGHTVALRSIDLRIEDGEFVALLGPSGCGKTTLLRLIAGFETPDGGALAIGGIEVARAGRALPPEERNIGMVFQSYALWPHMSVAQNVGFALKIRGVPAAERRRRIEQALDLVGLAGLAERRPHQLSGGQKQRVALARCLAMRPAVVLLDEPLANLDVQLRETMQAEFRRFHRESGATFVYVTHDQSEAMALADRVAVMDRGALQQVATPQHLYAEPATEMVARFVGHGMLLPVRAVEVTADRVVVDALGARFRVRGSAAIGERRALCVRPEDLRLGAEGIACRVQSAAVQGAVTSVAVLPERAGQALTIACRDRPPPAPGDVVTVAIADGWLMPREVQLAGEA
jgi:iron(III) transport system ATP-binding protein